MRRKLGLFLFLSVCSSLFAQQQEIRIWPGKAPGSEDWSFSETVTQTPDGGKSFSNIVDPTLTPFLPDPAKATGVAVIVCPGGAMRRLSWKTSLDAVEYLNGKGIAAFILKYRVVPDRAAASAEVSQSADAPPQLTPGKLPPPDGSQIPAAGRSRPELGQDLEIKHANANPAPEDEEHTKVIAMAIADGRQAIRIVRRNAAQYHIDPKRIGIMGISAGGAVVVGAGLAEQSDAYPDFLVSLYGPSLVDVFVPKHAAPLFIAVRNNHFNVTNGCVALFQAWKAAGRSAEMHIYEPGLPTDSWMDRLYDWLRVRKIITN